MGPHGSTAPSRFVRDLNSWMLPFKGNGIYGQGPGKGGTLAGVTTDPAKGLSITIRRQRGGRSTGNNASPATGGRFQQRQLCSGECRRLMLPLQHIQNRAGSTATQSRRRICPPPWNWPTGTGWGNAGVGGIRGPAKITGGPWLCRRYGGARSQIVENSGAEFTNNAVNTRSFTRTGEVSGGDFFWPTESGLGRKAGASPGAGLRSSSRLFGRITSNAVNPAVESNSLCSTSSNLGVWGAPNVEPLGANPGPGAFYVRAFKLRLGVSVHAAKRMLKSMR